MKPLIEGEQKCIKHRPPPENKTHKLTATLLASTLLLTSCTACSNTTTINTTQQAHTIAAATQKLPTKLVNGDFEAYAWTDLFKNTTDWGIVQPSTGEVADTNSAENIVTWRKVDGFDMNKFAWTSTQEDAKPGETANPGEGNIAEKRKGAVELQHDINGNIYAELCAYQAGTAIYQTIDTSHGKGAIWHIKLNHASLTRSHEDSMQVLVGPDMNHLTPVEMKRTGSNPNGHVKQDNSGKQTVISTPVTNKNTRDHAGQWATYEGNVLINSDTTVFTFKSISGAALNLGNLLDDISFQIAYPLTYDRNGATGALPTGN